MTLKQARKECRDLCIQTHATMWGLGWDKVNGYFPTCPPNKGTYTSHIAYVLKNGVFYAPTKENIKKHNLHPVELPYNWNK